MKNKLSKRLFGRNTYVFIGTDVPPLDGHEFTLYVLLIERIEKEQSLILSLDEIFENFTFTKEEKFLIVSRLIRNKVITRERVSSNRFKYSIVPKVSYRKCTEHRIYPNLNRIQKKELQAELKQMLK